MEQARETSLRDQVDNALDESRMLILGAQVSLGFQFQAVFQPGFDRLAQSAQGLMVVGLYLMLVAVGLLLAPGMYHQIVEARQRLAASDLVHQRDRRPWRCCPSRWA